MRQFLRRGSYLSPVFGSAVRPCWAFHGLYPDPAKTHQLVEARFSARIKGARDEASYSAARTPTALHTVQYTHQ